MMMDAYSNREIREKRIARLFREAYEQGALLTSSDVGHLIGVSPTTVSIQARKFMEKENVVQPTGGTIHDLGMATTHKRIILRFYLRGHVTSEITRLTDHFEEAVDRYIRAFEKVRLLRDKDVEFTHRVTGMSRWLVRAYRDLLQEFEEEVKTNENH